VTRDIQNTIRDEMFKLQSDGVCFYIFTLMCYRRVLRQDTDRNLVGWRCSRQTKKEETCEYVKGFKKRQQVAVISTR